MRSVSRTPFPLSSPSHRFSEGSSISFSAAAWRYNNAICANVTRPGLYVGSLILPDSFDRPSRTIGELAQAIVSSVLYWILTILGLAQLCHILRDHPRSERPKLGYTTLTLAFSVLRGIYFAIPSLVSSSAAAVVVVFEFPSLLFFIMFTTILYLWSVPSPPALNSMQPGHTSSAVSSAWP